MCILRDDPFVGRGTPLALVPQVPAFSGVIDHDTGIFQVVQDVQDRSVRPEQLSVLASRLYLVLLVLQGRHNSLSVKRFCNLRG